MTRRAGKQAAHVLSLNAYVHRATLGLPRTERLDAAAELRAHLLERVAELEGQGYARDEAEYLAVRGMGDPKVTNRQLLGHFFTTPLGWGCIGLLLAGIVGWQVVSQPKTRVKITGLDDFSLTLLLKGGTLPTDYFHLSFDVPPGTRFLKVTWISPGRVQESVLPVVGSHISGYVSVPTWRPWWKSRSPLPYADLPWSKTCHDEQPFHLSLEAQTSTGQSQRLPKPQGSNLNGLLWCSGIPPEVGNADSWWTTSAGNFSASATTPGLSVKTVKLDRWTPLMGVGHPRSDGMATDGGVLLVLPSDKAREQLPAPNYILTADNHFNEWKLTQP